MAWSYTIKESARAKRLRIAVYPDRTVVVTKPKHLKTIQVDAFVQSKRDWIEEKLESIEEVPSSDLRTTDHLHFLLHRSAARKLVKAKLEQWNQIYQFEYGFFSIKKMKTRWGSCSPKGTMSFNYKVLFLPEELQDLVIIHELCHIKEKNHSSHFWNLVSLAKPKYKSLQRGIRNL